MYLEEGINIINDKLTILRDKKRVAVWGTNENTIRLFQYTEIIKYNVVQFIDNGEAGRPFLGGIVVSPKEADWDSLDAVIISAYYKENEIFSELTSKWNFGGAIVRLNWKGQTKPFYRHYLKSELTVHGQYREIIQENVKFHNIHLGESIFIIGNGPSIKNTDLHKIRNAKKMVVSNFYLHKDFMTIKPDYYCFPQFTYTDLFDENIARKWIEDIGAKGGDPQFFFNISEKRLIDGCEQFRTKKVNYMYLENLNEERYDEIDASHKLMCGNSVPVDCIQLAIYMGFSNIYLVGVEHDVFSTHRYDYFYEKKQSVVNNTDISVADDGKLITGFQETLDNLYRLWKQYKRLKEIAILKNIKIYNASKGGMLDVFDITEYDALF